ncbi:MAG: EAL domain-containing protein [Proteobacteria bacterium]|nr:MAG: EAL domain-containing protein [Pseudomonadota bacterium]
MKPMTRTVKALLSANRPERSLKRDQIRMVFGQVPDSARISVLVAWILAVVIWPNPPLFTLVAWVAVFTVVSAARYVSANRFIAGRVAADGAPTAFLLAGVTATGLLWGAAGIFLVYTPGMIDIIVIATITIISVSAISFLAHYLPAYLLFLLASTLPMVWLTSRAMPPLAYAIFILYAIFLMAMVMTSYRFNRVLTDRLRLQHEAAALSERLTTKNEELLAELEQRQQTERELTLNKQYIDAIFANAPVELYLKDREGRYIKINRQFEKVFGVREQDVIGKLPFDIHDPELAREAFEHDQEVMANGEMKILEQSCRFPGIDDDQEHTLLTVKFPIKTDEQEIIGLGAVVFDITRQKHAENQLLLGRERFRDFAEIATDFYWEADTSMQLKFTSSRGQVLGGVPMAELIASRDGKLSGGKIVIDKSWRRHLEQRDANQPYEIEATFLRHNDKETRIHVKANPILDSRGQFAGYRGVARDVTREHRLQQEFAYQANHDPLTGQYNRRKFLQSVEEFLDDARGTSNTHLFCYVDLDRFKFVNDSSGHIAGDALLVEVSNVIRKHLRPEDVLGRVGGDEFGILLRNCTTNRGSSIGNQIIRGLQELDFQWGERRYTISASIGISVIDPTAGNATTVLSDADQACYRAKELGAGRVFVSNRTSSGFNNRAQSFRYTDWLDAFDKSLIQLYAQPIVSLSDPEHSWRWFELLIRLVDENGGEHVPENFVPYAERFGQMARVDRWVVAKAFEQIQSVENWQNCCFSINLSGASLHSDKLRRDILSRFSDSAVKPENICFEITETSAIKNLGLARNFIERLRGEGCRLALDDFGTGLASFSYLKHFPVDFVKIDGSFIQDLHNDPYNPIFVESICSVARAMNIKTVGECVESEEFLERLTRIGVDYAQGHAIGEPRPLSTL